MQPQILNTTRPKPEFGSQIKLGQSQRRIERSKVALLPFDNKTLTGALSTRNRRGKHHGCLFFF